MQRFFAPGRTELAGNHTDHQLGRVLAASVDVGIRARAARRRDRRVCIHSRGYRPFTVSLDDLRVDPRAYGKPWALVRGVAAAILEAGGQIGGFEAWASSALRTGGGLSSSAAFEILVGRIFNALYNGGAFTPEQLARFGQQAENRHFGKPSGLMDQMACARIGAVYLDLAAGEILPVAAPFAAMGLTLSLTDTGGRRRPTPRSRPICTALHDASAPRRSHRSTRLTSSPTGSRGLPTTARHTFSQKTRACRRCVMRLRAGMRGNICAS